MAPTQPTTVSEPYHQLLGTLKHRIATSCTRAVLRVNKELVLLYHHLGRAILEAQAQHGWGARVIDQLSQDLRHAFPTMKGFSPQNLKYMKRFATTYTREEIGQQAVNQIPWGHIVHLLYATTAPQERHFYIQETLRHGWSRSTLCTQVEAKLWQRQGRAVTNFSKKLPAPQSALAQKTLKDPYLFDFLSISDVANERAMENALVRHMEQFLLTLGAGFAFVGRQYHLEIGEQDFYIDLLFYHLKLRAFVVVELKTGAFKPEHAGKMNFYLAAVDDLIKHPTDQPSIGLILCKTKNNVVAEYALRDMKQPIGLRDFEINYA